MTIECISIKNIINAYANYETRKKSVSLCKDSVRLVERSGIR